MLSSATAADNGIWLRFYGSELAVSKDKALPCGFAAEFGLVGQKYLLLGRYNGQEVRLILGAGWQELIGCCRESLRYFLAQNELFKLLAKAAEVNHFYLTRRFCSRCGSKCRFEFSPLMAQCGQCGVRYYASAVPSIIVAIKKERSILLVNHHRHSSTQMYTLVAGYVEVGESAEQAVVREVREETGLGIDNISYITSQSWPFPNVLMLGYTADYCGGELRLQADEIQAARWCSSVDTDIVLPPPGTLSRFLIERVWCGDD